MGKAIGDGKSPYQLLPELSAQYLNSFEPSFNAHPSPHGPIIGIIFSYFTDVPLLLLSRIWFILSIIALLIATYLTTIQEVTAFYQKRMFIISSAIGISSFAFGVDLEMGQYSTFFLLLATLAWYAYKAQKDWLCGLLIGACFSLKYFFWPIILYFIIKKRWRIIASSALLFCVTTAASVYVLGFEEIAKYLFEVLPTVSNYWARDLGNTSIYSAIYKLFDQLTFLTAKNYPGYGSSRTAEIKILILVVSLLIPIMTVLSSLKSTDERAFLKLLTLSIISNPIAWAHYYIILLMPLMFATSKIVNSENNESKSTTISALIFLILYLHFKVDLESFSRVQPNEILQIDMSNLLYVITPAFLIILVTMLI